MTYQKVTINPVSGEKQSAYKFMSRTLISELEVIKMIDGKKKENAKQLSIFVALGFVEADCSTEDILKS